MLMPKKVKHRKMHKGRRRMKGYACRGNVLSFGQHGMKAMEPYWMTSRQIEAVRRVLTRYLRKGGKMWIRVFPDKPITKKGAEMPMGGGKGAVDHYVAVVKPGVILFEIAGIDKETAKKAFHLASYKLGIKTKFITKD